MLNNKLIIANAKFAVNIGSHSNGSISVSPTGKQLPGTIITITLSANTHYQFSSVSVTKASGGTVNLTTVTAGSKYTFKMPAANVTINASFSALPTYSVSINASGGSVRASKTSGIYAGEKITLTCTPNNYYALSNITSPQVSLSGSGNTRTFTMPSKNVTINATFVATYTNMINVDYEKRYYRGDDYNVYAGYKGTAYLKGSLSPNTFSGLEITGLYSRAYSFIDSWENTHHYRKTYIIFNAIPSFNSITLTRLDTNASITMTKDDRDNKQFSSQSDEDYTLFENKMFFKNTDENKNIPIKLVAS